MVGIKEAGELMTGGDGDAAGAVVATAGVGVEHVRGSHVSSSKQVTMSTASLWQSPHKEEHCRMAAQLMAAASSHVGLIWSGVAESKHLRQVSRVSSRMHATNASITSRHRAM